MSVVLIQFFPIVPRSNGPGGAAWVRSIELRQYSLEGLNMGRRKTFVNAADPDIDSVIKKFCDNLAERRWGCGYSQAHVAKMLGVTQVTVGRWERGKQTLSLTDAVRFMKVLGLEFKGEDLF